MSRVFELSEPDEEALAAAERALSGGRLVVLPTDTVYGVSARPDVPGATGRLFRAKGRSRALTLPVLAADLAAAEQVAPFDDRVRALAQRFWPGALTLVVRRSEASRGWDLGDEQDTVGLRVPGHPVAVALLRRTGPLAVTSANRSGATTPPDCEGVRAALGDSVEVYLCAGRASGSSSTVVDVTRSLPRVVRRGGIQEAQILSAWTRSV